MVIIMYVISITFCFARCHATMFLYSNNNNAKTMVFVTNKSYGSKKHVCLLIQNYGCLP
jgi:hypothetical protein